MVITKQEIINRLFAVRNDLINSNDKIEKEISALLEEIEATSPASIEKAAKEYEQKHEEPEVPRKK